MKTDTLGEGDVKMKTEIGEMEQQAKECQGLPENHEKLGRNKEGFSCMFQRDCGSSETLILDF